MKNIPKSILAGLVVLLAAIAALLVIVHVRERQREIAEKTSRELQSFDKAKPAEKPRERRPETPRNQIQIPDFGNSRTEMPPDRPSPEMRPKMRPFDRENPAEQFPDRGMRNEGLESMRERFMEASEPFDRDALRNRLQSIDRDALRGRLQSFDMEQIQTFINSDEARSAIEALQANRQAISSEQVQGMLEEARAAIQNGGLEEFIMNNIRNNPNNLDIQDEQYPVIGDAPNNTIIQERFMNRNMNRKPMRQ